MTRALLEAYWDLGQLMEGKDRAMEASEYRLKAIDGMRRMYGEKNKRMVKMVREHEKRSKKTPMSRKRERERGGRELQPAGTERFHSSS
jgi:hypothetical protein